MKTVLRIVYYIFSAILLLLAAAFCIIEGRLLFSGDWTIYESTLQGCVQYLCRFLMSLFALSIGLLPFVNKIKPSQKISDFLKTGSLALVMMSVIVCLFATNYVGISILGISLIYFFLTLFLK